MALELVIVTPEGVVWQGSVESVVLPGAQGDFGVLGSHERFLTSLRIGEAVIRTARESIYAAISDGYAQVSDDCVTVLADTCEVAAEIDVARAERARARAEQKLAELERDADERRRQEYEEALQRARTRIGVGSRSGA